jgi:lipid A 3-O-deacylase
MDGTMAVAVLALSLADMGVNYCPTDCFAAENTDSRWAFSTGAVVFQDEVDGAEVYLRRDFGVLIGPFQPSLGASIATAGSAWIGAGFLYTLGRGEGLYIQGNIMPGIYIQGEGNDLGGWLEFRSGVEIGYEANSGVRYGLSLDHRSNAGIYDENPGLETVQFRVSWRM